MPYDVYLHRTFDCQLSPIPSAVIDWAPEKRMVRAVLSGSGAPAALWSSTQPNVASWEEPLVTLEQRYHQLLVHQQQHASSTHLSNADGSGLIVRENSSSSGGGGGTNGMTAGNDDGLALYGVNGERAMHAATTPEGDVLRLYQVVPAQTLATPTGAGVAGGATTSGGVNTTHRGSAVGAGAANSTSTSPAPQADLTVAGPSPVMAGGVSEVHGPAGPHATAASPASTSPLQSRSARWGAPRGAAAAAPAWWPGWVPGGWLLGGSALPSSQPPLLLPPSPQTVSRDVIGHSYGSLPIYQSDTLVVSGALYAALGLNTTRVWQLTPDRAPKEASDAPITSAAASPSSPPDTAHSDLTNAIVSYLQHSDAAGGGNGGSRSRRSAAVPQSPASPTLPAGGAGPHIPIHTTQQGTSVVEVGAASESREVRVLDVLQLEWCNPKRDWRGVFSLRLLPPTLRTRVPICEYSMQTPWTEWSLQSDELVIRWSGFLTLYQQRRAPTAAAALGGEESAKSSVAPSAEPAAKGRAKAGSDGKPSAATRPAVQGAATPASVPQKPVVLAQAHRAAKKSTPDGETPPQEEVKRRSAETKTTGPAPTANDGPTHGATSPAAPAPVPAAEAPVRVVAPELAMPAEAKGAVRSHAVPWWRLRGLKVGAGVAVKNDLASGINLYWGLSGRMGRGLAFSGHVDALRRLCATSSLSLGAVDASVRLRMNLITFHKTGLDVGVVYRPFSHTRPNTAVRVACSNSKYTVGLQLHDVVHDWFRFLLPHAVDASRSHGGGGGLTRAGQSGPGTDSALASPAERSWWGAIKHTLRMSSDAADGGSGPSQAAAPTRKSPAGSASLPPTPESVATAAPHAEGSWISAGWATATWGYITHHVGALFGGGGEPRTETDGQSAAPTSPKGSTDRLPPSRSGKGTTPVSSQTVASGNGVAVGGALQRGHAWVRGQTQQVARQTTQAYHHVGAWADTAWLSVRGWQARFVAPMLDSTRVDVSVGVTCDRRRPSCRSWSSFVMISVH